MSLPAGEASSGNTPARDRVPVTVLVPTPRQHELLHRFAADPDNLVIASRDTLAAAGVLGLIRIGRAVVVAPDVTSRTPGCECCQVRVDLIEATRNAILRRKPPARLIVVVDQALSTACEAPCDSDPASDVVTCVHTLQADSDIERLARLDGLIVEVDAPMTATRLSCGLPPWSAQQESSLAIADRIVVAGAELLTATVRAALTRRLRTVNRIGHLLPAGRAEIGVDHLVDLDAWGRVPVTSTCWSRTPPAGDESRRSAIDTVVLTRAGILDPDATDAWLDRVVAEAPSRLFRLQAALSVSTHEHRVCVGGSRSAMRSQPERSCEGAVDVTSPAADRNDADSVVVLIGRDLDAHSLNEGFRAIEVHR